MSRLSLRLATADDLRFFAGREIPPWCIEWCGWVAEREGEPIAIGSIVWDKWGRCWGAFDKKGPVSPFLMHRLAKRTLVHLRNVGVGRLHTCCDEWVPGAEKWLKRLGFVRGPMVLDDRPVWIRDLT